MPAFNRQSARTHVDSFNFTGLFTEVLGWDWPEDNETVTAPFAGDFIQLSVIAQKRGVKVLRVPADPDGRIVDSRQRKLLEKAVTPIVAEHLLIFTDAPETQQIWLWTSRIPGQPIRQRELKWERDRSNENLFQKLTSIAFTLDDEEALDITGVVNRLRDSLDRDKVTKKFYEGFKKLKDTFQNFIEGLSDEGALSHYTSLMLNRLMFCYFLQKKSFLDNDPDYLKNRLAVCRDRIGEDHFHSFYRSFLRRLFHEALDLPESERPDEIRAIIGENIPYLNGGLFDEHPIERGNPDIHIPDQAFERIFAFFDQYHWHLDDRPLGNDNEINPEVLGYVFEKYTNQKQMGAYYTKEDITEYISRSTILPYLLSRLVSEKKLPAESWQLLAEDPDRYIFPAVKHGADQFKTEAQWEASLPANISRGLNPPSLHDPVKVEYDADGNMLPIATLELRKDWNTPAPASHALPTEIWRESITRQRRFFELRQKLAAGEIETPEQLITHNLNIVQFVNDVIADAPPATALALWKILRSLTVLDPTCGSGAFLFAALNILEPLYEGLLQRFRSLLADWEQSGEQHKNWQPQFQEILNAVERHPNETYFIHKTAIVHNLYGVDIMEEAVEICKLRLFLQLAAKLDPGQEVEPLPDIDFNIRAGNTLVGYASRADFDQCSAFESTGQMRLLDDDQLVSRQRIYEAADIADRGFRRFQEMQDQFGQDATEFRDAKTDLENRLQGLRNQLDRFLAADYNTANVSTDEAFKKWRKSHEPFHWIVEFFGILENGGFDVVIGNPPYVEYSEVSETYKIRNFTTEVCGNLYAFCWERSTYVSSANGVIAMIIPVASVSTGGYASMRELWDAKGMLVASSYNDRPSKLFDGLEHIRLAIPIHLRWAQTSGIYTTGYTRWASDARSFVFQNLNFDCSDVVGLSANNIQRIGCESDRKIATALRNKPPLGRQKTRNGCSFYYTRKLSFYVQVLDFIPRITDGDGNLQRPSELKSIAFESESIAQAAVSILNSSLFFWFISAESDCRNLNKREVEGFPIDPTELPSDAVSELSLVCSELMTNFDENSEYRTSVYKKWGTKTIQSIFPKHGKSISDRADIVIADFLQFEEETLDFIVNYAIKFRLGI